MRKLTTLLLSSAVVMWTTNAAAQKHQARPATAGIEHAETTANPNGQRGIENAESKQATHADSDKDNDKDKDVNEGKHKAKGKKAKKH